MTAGGKRGAPINLQAGKAYYIEALHERTSSNGTLEDTSGNDLNPDSPTNDYAGV